LRLLSLFILPGEMGLEPNGWIGVRKRRETCRELNSLLARFKQTPIVGSGGLHFMDLDPSTIVFGMLCFFSLFLSLYVTTLKLQILPEIANVLLWKMGSHLAGLMLGAIGLILVHDLILIRRCSLPVYKWISASIGILAFSVLTIVVTMKTGREMQFEKMAYHCWYQFRESSCREQLAKLSPEQRFHLYQHLQRLESEIAIRK
jgi:hypothetical protein